MGTNCWSQTLEVSTIVTFMAYYLLKLPFILNVWISTIFGCSYFCADIAEKHIYRNLSLPQIILKGAFMISPEEKFFK